MSAGGIRPRLVAVWLVLLVLVGAIVVIERTDLVGLSSRRDGARDPRMLLPVPVDQLGAIEVAHAGALHRFERDAAGAWFYHGVHTKSEGAHGHQADPSLAERIGRAFAEIELTRLLNYRALTKIIKGQPNWPEVPLAKLQWSSIAQTLAELAVDLLGPDGLVLKGSPDAIDGGQWARSYSWQRYTSIGAGATEIQKNIIAKKALRMGPQR